MFYAFITKNEPVDKLPESQVDYLKEVARDFRGKRTLATAYPTTNFTSEWFTKWMDEGGKAYAEMDARLEENQTTIAEFCGFDTEWAAYTSASNYSTTPKQQIYNDLFFMYTKKGSKKNVYTGPKEGLHRGFGDTIALNRSRIDVLTAQVVYKSLTLSDFFSAGLEPEGAKPTEEALNAAIDNLHDPKRWNTMIDNRIPVTITYVKDPNCNLPALNKAMRDASRAISDDKRSSAAPSPLHSIGKAGEDFIMSFAQESVRYQPKTGHEVLCSETK